MQWNDTQNISSPILYERSIRSNHADTDKYCSFPTAIAGKAIYETNNFRNSPIWPVNENIHL
jgi:hypothetical protein